MAMNLYKSTVTINGTSKKVIEINIPDGQVIVNQKETKSYDGIHFIHILDRSGSMYAVIDELMENVKKTLSVMSDKDLISIIWFASEGQYKTLLKGAKIDTPNINELIDSLKSVLGCTCFSEPMHEANEIIDDLKSLCPNIAVTLFTDGNPVVYDYNAEIKKIDIEATRMGLNVIAINTIGYGYYYNKDLLVSIAEKSQLGKYFHSSMIDDYMDIFKGNYEIMGDMVLQSFNIKADGKEILYLNRNSSSYSKNENNIRFLSKRKNQFFIISDDDNDFDFTLNGEVYKSQDIKKSIPKATLLNFLYALSYEYAYRRNKLTKYLLVQNVKDKNLADKYINAFTNSEIQTVCTMIKKTVFNNKKRYLTGECDENYLPKSDAFCVMDLFNNYLLTGRNYYIPVKDYNRIGLKVTDTFNLFKADDKEILAPITDLTWNEKYLNLSIRYMINGTVDINPKSAKAVNLPEHVKSKIYRYQTIIKDGNLNINEFDAVVDTNTFIKMMEDLSSIDGLITILGDYGTGAGLQKIHIDLTKIPIINEKMAEEDDIDKVAEAVIELNTLKAEQKVINYLINNSKDKPTFKSAGFESTDGTFVDSGILNEDQIRVLGEHGLNAKFEYNGVNNVTSEKVETDFYMSRLLEFTLKGWSSLPPVEKILNGTKMNEPAKVMDNCYTECYQLSYETLNSKLDTIKNRIREISNYLATIKMAKVLSASWWTSDKIVVDKKENYTYDYNGKTIVIKNDYVKKYF